MNCAPRPTAPATAPHNERPGGVIALIEPVFRDCKESRGYRAFRRRALSAAIGECRGLLPAAGAARGKCGSCRAIIAPGSRESVGSSAVARYLRLGTGVAGARHPPAVPSSASALLGVIDVDAPPSRECSILPGWTATPYSRRRGSQRGSPAGGASRAGHGHVRGRCSPAARRVAAIADGCCCGR